MPADMMMRLELNPAVVIAAGVQHSNHKAESERCAAVPSLSRSVMSAHIPPTAYRDMSRAGGHWLQETVISLIPIAPDILFPTGAHTYQ